MNDDLTIPFDQAPNVQLFEGYPYRVNLSLVPKMLPPVVIQPPEGKGCWRIRDDDSTRSLTVEWHPKVSEPRPADSPKETVNDR